jgi:uncharacterized protein
VPKDGTIMMPTGHVSVEQLTAVLSTLPLDRPSSMPGTGLPSSAKAQIVFSRVVKQSSDAQVHHCHPPRSADTVNKMYDFRSGRQNVAEFWINFQSKFVHIRYFAVRDDERKYLGTVELTQDLASLRQLSGERRLLAYDSTAETNSTATRH